MKRKAIVLILVFCALGIFLYGAQAEGKKAGSYTINGVVEDISKQPVSEATVYLVPVGDIIEMAKNPIEIKRDSKNDEPLADNIAMKGEKYLKAVTNKKGEFTLKGIEEGKFFVYVAPAGNIYLPGGNKANKAMSASELSKGTLKILVSGNVPEGATFVGTTKCIGCHKAYESEKKTLHKLGIAVVGKPGKLQDPSRFPEFNKGLDILKKGIKFYFYGFDKKRGFDKYYISDKAPVDPASVSFTATFFTDTDGKLKFKTENLKDQSDPARTYTVEMTYGGGLYKQRYLVRVGKNLFPFVQYNTTGDESYGSRTRKPWRDYHGDWFYNEDTKKLTNPPIGKSFEKECASCHYTGYTLKKLETGEYIAGAVNDPNGEADIDGDGMPNELNIGCETCHGPGSEHIKAPNTKKGSTIVSPGKLAAERSSVICGQCHSRPKGNLDNDQPVNKDNKMMLPGISRNDYLVNYTTREDAAKGDYWQDGLHSKSHHQQYTDLLKSKKYRNGSQLIRCSDCHDPHGMKDTKHQMRFDVRDANNSLCSSCHKGQSDITKHMQQKTGAGMMGKISCVDCHATKTMQTGAGLGKGLTGKDGKNYWMNDITSHIFDVPKKDNPGVKGIAPGDAMPVPYTNACGKCHKADNL